MFDSLGSSKWAKCPEYLAQDLGIHPCWNPLTPWPRLYETVSLWEMGLEN